ncbi:unnamed protein product [Caenorhabditis angaria]|uniref:Uncharacterized protein n=1 Tax=Caenorhabditis angaria TaxID=860376 RepID=A0A9P1IU46_9PELO|nr:unnamed protein product [Caenorhabditis angaria]
MKIRDFSVLCKTLDYKTSQKLTRLTIIDALIGWMILVCLDITIIHETVWNLAEDLVQHLDNVITILENNPAGLKLIIPVNQTLSSFFRYHIYLWTTFIHFLKYPQMTRFVICFLLAGFTTFLAALCDVCKFFFIHFLCFDAYATRLWSVCSYTLKELWGLVRGKKWNPLRKRNDNVSFSQKKINL